MNKKLTTTIDTLNKPQRLLVLTAIASYCAGKANGLPRPERITEHAIDLSLDEFLLYPRDLLSILMIVDVNGYDLYEVMNYITQGLLKG